MSTHPIADEWRAQAAAANAESTRRLEADVATACVLLQSAREWVGPISDSAGVRPAVLDAIDAFLQRHNAPASWGGRGTA